jgi:hypothetical protein
MFHHDPYHSDDDIDRLRDAALEAADGEVEVIAAYEGMVISLPDAAIAGSTDDVPRSAVGG